MGVSGEKKPLLGALEGKFGQPDSRDERESDGRFLQGSQAASGKPCGTSVDVHSVKRKAVHPLSDKTEKTSIRRMTACHFEITGILLQRKSLEE